jgi:hypothetical protein
LEGALASVPTGGMAPSNSLPENVKIDSSDKFRVEPYLGLRSWAGELLRQTYYISEIQ